VKTIPACPDVYRGNDKREMQEKGTEGVWVGEGRWAKDEQRFQLPNRIPNYAGRRASRRVDVHISAGKAT